MSEDIRFNKKIPIEDITIEHWLANEGEAVKEGQQLVTVKANHKVYVVRSPIDGILIKKNYKNGDTLNLDNPLGEIVTNEEAKDKKIENQLTPEDLRILNSLRNGPHDPVKKAIHVKATPSARQRARKEKINLEEVNGTGPEGRIQLQDVIDFVNQNNKPKEKKRILKNKPKKVLYGLPLTALAQRLAKRNHIDVTKIPAPPDATKIKKKDVERYLRNPEGAEDEIERAYTIYNLTKLNIPEFNLDYVLDGTITDNHILIPPKEEPSPTIYLHTEEPLVIPSGDVIELDQKFKSEREKLETPVIFGYLDVPPLNDGSVIRLFTDEPLELTKEEPINLEGFIPEQTALPVKETILFLEEPEPQIIRLHTTEPSDSSDNTVITLDDKSPILDFLEGPVEILLLEEPEGEVKPEVIKLHSEVIPEAKGEEVIILAPSEVNSLNNLDENTFKSLFAKPSEKALISTLVNMDLIDLMKKYNPPINEIGNFAKNYILTRILKVLRETIGSRAKNIVYVSDILENTYATFDSIDIEKAGKQISKSIKEQNVSLDDGNIIIVDLLPYSIDDVQGLIETEQRIVIYLSYLKQLERFFTSDVDVNSILKISVNYDTDVLEAKDSIRMIDEFRVQLESLGDDDEQ